MRAAVDRLLRDGTLVGVGLAIALGWALFQVAEGVSVLVTTLLSDYPAGSDIRNFGFEPLTWDIGGRVLTFGELARGLVEFAVVLAVALVIARRRPATP